MIASVAVRNLVRMRRRYFLIAIAVIIAFAVMTLLTGLSKGMMDAMRIKAARYFAGHASITSYGGYFTGLDRVAELRGMEDLIRQTGLRFSTISRRTVYYNADATLFFGGETVRQRRLVGLDFTAEKKEFSGLAFSGGGIEGMEAGGGILISESAALLMGAKVGDDITLLITSDTGQYNTATLILRGIFRESSIFGFASYLDIEDMNRLTGKPEGSATDIAVFFKDSVDLDKKAEAVRVALAVKYPVFPRMETKKKLEKEVERNGERKFAILSLNAHLYQFKELVDAFVVVTYFVLAMFLFVVLIGIMNTYRVIVHERTREIGTMRAIGMRRSDVVSLFLAEALVLSIICSIIGFAFGLFLLAIVGLFDFSLLPAAGMFLEDGHVLFAVDKTLTALNFLIMTTVMLFAAFGSARLAAKIHPADALRMEG